MDEQEIKNLLATLDSDVKSRGWRCPDENRLAAYFNGQLKQESSTTLERHIADCRSCLQTLVLLARTNDVQNSVTVPANLLIRARALAGEKQVASFNWRWAMAAATACLLVVIGVVTWRTRSQQSSIPPSDLVAQHQPAPEIKQPPVTSSTPVTGTPTSLQNAKTIKTPERKVRGESDQLLPTVISPHDGALIKTADHLFSWNSVPGATSYEVRVVTEEGGPVLSERTSSNYLKLNVESLLPGKYFVTIVAHMSGERTVKSLSSFRVANR